jgi:hypothetical protein
MNKFINLINTVIEEQELNIDKETITTEPEKQSEEINSALPTPETIDLNEEKYKTLLSALKKSLYKSTTNLDLKNKIAEIKIEEDPKKAEELLMAILDQTEMPQTSE